VSLNRWVFKWRLKVRMFAQSNVSRSRVPGGWSSNRRSAMCVYKAEQVKYRGTRPLQFHHPFPSLALIHTSLSGGL